MIEIVESSDQETITHLIDILDHEDVVYRRAAVKVLGMIGSETVSPLVEALLKSENVTVRGSAAKALAQVAVNYPEDTFPPEGLQGLKAAIDDANPVVHIAAVMALGEIGPDAFEILQDSLNTTDNIAVQVAIVNAMVSLGDPRSKAVLTAFAEDESADTYVRESATSALSRLDFVTNSNR